MINEWLEIKEKLNELQERERTLRMALCEQVLQGKKEGSVTTLLGGVKCTATAVVSYTIDKAELDLIYPELTEEERACIKYTPELKLREYRGLSNSNLAKAVFAKPGMPQFKIV